MKNYYNRPAGHHTIEIAVPSEVELPGLRDELRLGGFTFLVEGNLIIVFYQGAAGRQKLFDICEKRFEIKMKL